MIAVAKKNIFKIKPYVPGKPMAEVRRELGLNSVIKLASNESPFGPSPKVERAMAHAAKQVNRYPDGSCYYLRRALARKLKVSENQLIFGNGSDELIVLAIRAFASQGDEVIMAKPSFLIYAIATQLEGAKPVYVPLRNFRYDLMSMKAAITAKTKIIFIGNPDNPSGTYVTKSQVENFLKDVSPDVIVFFDEAYFEFVHSRRTDYPDTIALLKKYPNVVTTRTFSKLYGLAGLRIGYGVADAGIVDVLNRLREPFNVNVIAQEAALACLNDTVYYRAVAQKIEDQRKYFIDNFCKLGLSFVETVTNFMLLNVGSNSSRVAQKLLKQGVIIRDMAGWGLKGYIRVTIGTKQENRKFIKALRGIL